MPGRKIPLVNGEIYHVFNRGVAAQPTYLDKRDYQRALETLVYYQNRAAPLSYSFFVRLPQDRKVQVIEEMKKKKEFLADVIAYCLMPNHFHLILRQLRDGGISFFMSNFTNSYTRYFNTRNERIGPLYQGKFKAVRIETDEQLLHISRYIHLNPYTSFVLKTLSELERYQYSSFGEYLNSLEGICGKDLVLGNFKTTNLYRKFVLDQADYQRNLSKIKHLVLEK